MVKWIPTVPEEEVVVITNGKEDICGQVIIISYELLNRKQYEFVNMNPQVVILDESHLASAAEEEQRGKKNRKKGSDAGAALKTSG